MKLVSAVSALRRRARLFAPQGADSKRLDVHRWRTLADTEPSITADVVRAAYVAILEREPDAEGLAAHADELRRGLPIELLLAKLARARDDEHTSRRLQELVEERAAEAATLSALRDLVQSQRRTILALTRRFAALEDRLLVADDSPQPPPSATGG